MKTLLDQMAAIQANLAQRVNQAQAQTPPQKAKTLANVPAFRYDSANPSSASNWIQQLNVLFKLHDVDDNNRVAIALGGLDSSTFQKVSRAILSPTVTDVTDYKDWPGFTKIMTDLFDRSESLFAKRYSFFQIEWKGPEHESIADLSARLQHGSMYAEIKNMDENAIQTLVLLMSMKSPALEPFRVQLLQHLNTTPKKPFKECIDAITAALQLGVRIFLLLLMSKFCFYPLLLSPVFTSFNCLYAS